MVTEEEIVAVLTEARASAADLAVKLAAASTAFGANPTQETFEALCRQHADHKRQAQRLSLLESWASGLGVEVAA